MALLRVARPHRSTVAGVRRPEREAFLLLRTVFAIAPVLFGVDKFTGLLTDWDGEGDPDFDGLRPIASTGTC